MAQKHVTLRAVVGGRVQSGTGQDCGCPAPPSHEPLPKIREVLECASPLALWQRARNGRRAKPCLSLSMLEGKAPEDWRTPRRWRANGRPTPVRYPNERPEFKTRFMGSKREQMFRRILTPTLSPRAPRRGRNIRPRFD